MIFLHILTNFADNKSIKQKGDKYEQNKNKSKQCQKFC